MTESLRSSKMSRRDELLAGVKTLNRQPKEIGHERHTSKKVAAAGRAGVEAELNQRLPRRTGDTGARVSSDKDYIQEDEESLESVLRSQVDVKSKALSALELEVADCEARLRGLMTKQLSLKYDIQTAIEVIGKAYDDNQRGRTAKGPVPKEGPGLKDETRETSHNG